MTRQFPSGADVIAVNNCPLGHGDPAACEACDYGHVDECHHPIGCEEAGCAHYAPAAGDTLFDVAKRRLEEMEAAYAALGNAGYFVLLNTIRPLRERFNSGEQTKELFDAIMAIK